jgi:hypothetical protein
LLYWKHLKKIAIENHRSERIVVDPQSALRYRAAVENAHSAYGRVLVRCKPSVSTEERLGYDRFTIWIFRKSNDYTVLPEERLNDVSVR